MKHPCMEQLDSRRLLSAVLKSGILTITGTENADTINFWFGENDPRRLIVRDGVNEFSFDKRGIRLIRVQGLGGDDHIAPLNVGGEVNINISADGGAGDDQIIGGSGNDTLIGGPGNDDLRGGKGIDYADYRYVTTTFQPLNSALQYGLIAVMDGKTNDQTSDGTDNIQTDIEGIFGTKFRDSIVCSGVANTIFGGDGPDHIDGSNGDDSLVGGNGANSLIGGVGNDTLVGGAGLSTLEGDSGNDVLLGGSGDEVLAGGTGSDTYDGGAGFDSADFSGDPRAFHLTFDGKANDGPGREDDNFIEIDSITTTSDGDRVDASGFNHGLTFHTTGHGEDITGSEFADTLSMEDGTINGLGGNDLLEGGLAGSTAQSAINGGSGNDSIRTADGADTLSGGPGQDSISSGDGNDTVDGGSGNDTVRAGDGDDQITGGSGTDHLYGEGGNDTISGNGKHDFIFGGDGADAFTVADSDDGFVQDFDPGSDRLISGN